MVHNNKLGRTLFLGQDLKFLLESSGEYLCFASDSLTLPLDMLNKILDYAILQPIYRISVLHEDETVDYVIPNADIVSDGIQYNENYSNGQRRDITLKLVNVTEHRSAFIKWEDLPEEERQFWGSSRTYYDSHRQSHMKYVPNVNGLWYGKKIKYDIGIMWNGSPYYFNRGIYIIEGFDFAYGTDQRVISYNLKDKFSRYTNATGTLEVGYEIPVDTPIEEVIKNIQNMSGTDGTVNDLIPYIIDNNLATFRTQSTIRVDAGGKIGDIYEQLALQMSAEYYYNTSGNLCFYRIDESLNDIDKPIIWQYTNVHLSGFNLKSEEEIINAIKVIGDNVDGELYSAIVKNDNLNSPINIYYLKERYASPIQSPNIWSDEMAMDLGKYELRKKSIVALKQSIEVPFNPLLVVNSIIEIKNQDLEISNQRFLINAISYTSGSLTMSLEVVNIDELPLIGQVTH